MQCSVYIAVSLDGFIARSDGTIDWLANVQRAGEDYGYKRFFDAIDTVIIGRKTYDQVLGFDPWPYAGKRCVVMTHAPPVSRHGETFFDGSALELVAGLREDGARRAYVDGGLVIQQFLAAGLVTDLTLSVIPILLGEGIRLFGKTGRDVPLALIRSTRFDTGLAQLEYRIAAHAT